MTVQIENKYNSNRLRSMREGHEFIYPYYYAKLQPTDLEEIQEYISNLPDDDYEHNEFDHGNKKQYRSCEIHFPKRGSYNIHHSKTSNSTSFNIDSASDSESILHKIGKKMFKSINEKYYQYDLSDVFEFQLIKYYVGGNYNWHCDYGIAPRTDIIRKLSMTIQLSDPYHYEGGELKLANYANVIETMAKSLGTTLVFDSRVAHKVRPVISGERIALVGWASGPPLR